MSKLMSKIWTQFRGGCILRGNLIKFNNNITSQIETDLKFENLITERQQLVSLTHMLSKKVKGLEGMVCDLTRAIKRMEFDRNMDLEKKANVKRAPAEQPTEASPTPPPAPSDKKKITQCR
ncbi:uncharacterized protein LOC111076123 [Drosophila obscura]|uniref:uncharacterized protein LOC111076123 n=1 Tax=Drosophila obscura TaxID=7282 RepID=UPI000BA0BE5A|nr:uncharacterized protein LOC111076123 [Drosophila obscura]